MDIILIRPECKYRLTYTIGKRRFDRGFNSLGERSLFAKALDIKLGGEIVRVHGKYSKK